MSTIRLYHEDAYLLDFSATILKSLDCTGNPAAILDQTCFYPESGGQPADSGLLDGVDVWDVQEKDGEIFHILARPLDAGKTVKGEIDFGKRWDHMQQHTGQHVLSQSFFQIAGAETVGFHLGRETATIDLNREEFSAETLFQTEILANRIVLENRSIQTQIIPRDRAMTLPLRKIPEEGDPLRIVEIEGFDLNSCCGTHLLTTAEVGQVKIVRTERYKGGTRVSFLCGWRALKDYQKKHRLIREVCQTLSANEDEILPNLERLETERKAASKTVKLLSEKVGRYEADRLSASGERIGALRLIVHLFEDEEVKTVQAVFQKLIGEPDVIALFGVKTDRGHLLFGRSKNVNIDLRPIFRSACGEMDGRGGGSTFLVQGSGSRPDGLEAALKRARQEILQNLP